MSKQAKGTVNVWLSSGTYTRPSELQKLDGKELVDLLYFQNADMSSFGWTRVGTAEVIITLDDCKTVTANQVAILQSQLKEMRAEHQQAQNRLMKQIQELLAIDNEVQAPPQSAVHQIIHEDDLLAADRARNVNKAGRAIEREAERGFAEQLKRGEQEGWAA